MDAQREDDMYKHVRHGDCSRCSRTYGTLGCCSTVSNKWYYSCEEGMKEYTDSAISKTWEMAKKITSLSPFILDRLFETSEPAEVFSRHTWEEAVDILSKYIEEEDAKKRRMAVLRDKVRSLVEDGYTAEEITGALDTTKYAVRYYINGKFATQDYIPTLQHITRGFPRL